MTVWICCLAMNMALAGELLAAAKGAKEPVAARPAAAKKSTPASLAKNQAGLQPPKQTQDVQKRSNLGSHRGKVHKKVLPKAVVRPRTDLAYHGMLEDSQRYDPRPNHRAAGVHDPQTPALLHDHFQELDRNRDGKIDPVERAFGRLDMDRDLPNHHP